MKKIILWIIISTIWLFWLSFAENFLNLWDFLTVYFEWIGQEVPESWQYIEVKYDNVRRNSELYKSLQKWIYMDIFPNIKWQLPIEEYLTQEKVVWLLNIKDNRKFNYKRWEKINLDWTKYMIYQWDKINVSNDKKEIINKVFKDIQQKLDENYIYPKEINQNQMDYWAIQWYIDAINDPYTVFFPPKEAKNFDDSLNGSFEWIWAYIDMIRPWIIIISSPLKNSPAEKYWVKAWDIIVKVWNHKITKDTSTQELVDWIKWPAWTFVDITVKRWDQEKILKIKREKIILPNIEYELMEWWNCYVSINQFNSKSRNQFKKAINYFQDKSCEKYIFDVRNNPGGVLDDVWYILNYFVPDGKSTVNIKYKNIELEMVSNNSTPKLSDENIVVLINWGSASASEIFAGVIKDYLPNSILLGTKSFGKGSVQNLVEYTDGSMFKYTVAKRFTGRSKTNIDLQWIEPDLKLEDDIETEMDEVLEVAKIYKFR